MNNNTTQHDKYNTRQHDKTRGSKCKTRDKTSITQDNMNTMRHHTSKTRPNTNIKEAQAAKNRALFRTF